MSESKVIFYASKNNGASKRLQRLIGSLVPENSLEINRTIKNLSKSLSHSRTYKTLAILLADNKADLLELLAICDLLINIRIILVLPDDEKETIAKGHLIYPRFISFITSDFKDVGATLEKILKTFDDWDYETGPHQLAPFLS